MFRPPGTLMGDTPIPDDQRSQFPLGTHVGQLVMVKLPCIGIVPMTPAKPRGLYMPGKPWTGAGRPSKLLPDG